MLQSMGGAMAILVTGTSGSAMGPLVTGLAERGKRVPSDSMQQMHSRLCSEDALSAVL
jgi:hypothetical protein